MIRVDWHTLSRRELFESLDFYEREIAGLGGLFLDRVEQALAQIRDFPQAGTPSLGQTRKRRVSRFPYDLIYRVEATAS